MKEGSERIVGSPETIFSFFELLLNGMRGYATP